MEPGVAGAAPASPLCRSSKYRSSGVLLSVSNRKPQHIAILGGGLAGLFAAYHLTEAGFPVTVYEEKDRIGGNCVTYRSGDFYFDSGAHRFHDMDWVATETIKGLLGDCLKRTDTPSRVYSGGKLVDFPLSALNLLKSLGMLGFARSTYQIARSRLMGPREPEGNLKGYVTRTYGSEIAERFLLNYSEKLWGITPDRLSSGIAKVRLKGLSIQGFLKEAVRGTRGKTGHLDGAFYYPEDGIGAIADRLAEAVGSGVIRKRSKVTKVEHNGRRIQSIVINGADRVDVDELISTIPLPHLLEILDPLPEEAVMAPASTLRYRNLILVAVFLPKDSVTPDATVYFPESDFVFTRAYEPKNRARSMAPPGRTSLVLEVPCDPGDCHWHMPDEKIVELVLSQLAVTGWVMPGEILGAEVRRMEHAYPVVDVDTVRITERLLGFLEGFSNLRVSGRNGRFVYCSIHDLMKESREIARDFVQPILDELSQTLKTELWS